jgi:hypothetical protein
VPSATSTDISLVRAGAERGEGDRIVLRADLLGAEGALLASHEWFFAVEKLGWSSRFAAGIGFAGRLNAAADQKLRPVPILAWVLRYRTGGDATLARLLNAIDPGIGIHTTTFSSDAQPIQVGMGLTLNLFNDFVQSGVGWKLQPADASDRPYFYVGLGLFKLVGAV